MSALCCTALDGAEGPGCSWYAAESWLAVLRADPVMLQLTCVLSLQRVVPTLSGLAAGLLVAALMVPLAQIQSIHDVS